MRLCSTTSKVFDLLSISREDDAQQSCPFFPAKTALIHRTFDDPPTLTARASNEEEAMAPYRRVRDEIGVVIETFPQSLSEDV